MNKDIDELLLMRTEQRDQFEAECQRLRRERDEAREALQWVAVLVASNKVNTVRAMYLALERILRPLWPDGPTAPMDFITAIQRNIKQAHCCHNASAQKVDGDVSLVCRDCGASAPLFGVMQRLLEGKPEEKWPHGPPLPPVANIVAGQIVDAEYAAVIESVDEGVGTGGPIVPSRNDEPHNYHE